MDALCNSRYHMWCRYIGGYATMTLNQRHKAKSQFINWWGYTCLNSVQPEECDKEKAIENMMRMFAQPATYGFLSTRSESLAVLEEFDFNRLPPLQTMAQEQKEQAMNITTAINTDDRAREYLASRIFTIWQEKLEGLRRQYGLLDTDYPTDPKDLKEKLSKGLYEIRKPCCEDEEDFDYSGEWVRWIIWRDPSVKKDKEGYKTAKETLDKAFTVAKDAIKVLGPEEGLKALREFESATYH